MSLDETAWLLLFMGLDLIFAIDRLIRHILVALLSCLGWLLGNVFISVTIVIRYTLGTMFLTLANVVGLPCNSATEAGEECEDFRNGIYFLAFLTTLLLCVLAGFVCISFHFSFEEPGENQKPVRARNTSVGARRK